MANLRKFQNNQKVHIRSDVDFTRADENVREHLNRWRDKSVSGTVIHWAGGSDPYVVEFESIMVYLYPHQMQALAEADR